MATTKPGVEAGSKIPYLFNAGGNAAFAAIYGDLVILHTLRWYLERKRDPKTADKAHMTFMKRMLQDPHNWSLTLPIAEWCMFIGLVFRLILRTHQQNLMLFCTSNLYVMLSPTAFIGFVYMMYGRLILALDVTLSDQSTVKERSYLSLIAPRIVGRFFIACDFTCFVIQAIGGGMEAGGDQFAITGNNIFLAGVILQTFSYSGFLIALVLAHIRIARHIQPFSPRTIFVRSAKANVTSRLLAVTYFVSACMLIRSCFRTAEMSYGWSGKLYNNEHYLFLLDIMPLAIGNACWVVWWPPTEFRKIRDHMLQQQEQQESQQSQAQSLPSSNAATATKSSRDTPTPHSGDHLLHPRDRRRNHRTPTPTGAGGAFGNGSAHHRQYWNARRDCPSLPSITSIPSLPSMLNLSVEDKSHIAESLSRPPSRYTTPSHDVDFRSSDTWSRAHMSRPGTGERVGEGSTHPSEWVMPSQEFLAD